MKLSTIGSIFSIFLLCFPLKANAQVFNSETLYTLKICQAIANMQTANPNNYALRVGRRECNLRAYYVQLCTSSGYEYRTCWDNYYTQAIHVNTQRLRDIVNNNL
jgi:hypothetical protein